MSDTILESNPASYKLFFVYTNELMVDFDEGVEAVMAKIVINDAKFNENYKVYINSILYSSSDDLGAVVSFDRKDVVLKAEGYQLSSIEEHKGQHLSVEECKKFYDSYKTADSQYTVINAYFPINDAQDYFLGSVVIMRFPSDKRMYFTCNNGKQDLDIIKRELVKTEN